MKHNSRITLILITMFLVTQLIGLAVVYADPLNLDYVNESGEIITGPNPAIPFITPPEIKSQEQYFNELLPSIIIAFALAIILIFVLTHFKAAMIIRAWFFFVVFTVVYITLIAFQKLVPFVIELKVAMVFAAVVSLLLAYFKIFKRNLIAHNLTELLIYPGISVVFIPLLNVKTIVILLILISLYDMWAVWHSGFMQKMANFQINELKVFGGFFVPYLNKKQRAQVKAAKKSKSKSSKLKTMKVNLAILGGGDVVFPIITSGIVMLSWGLIPALITTLGATVALALLFIYSQKGKFYPAMPFVTAGLFVGMAIGYHLR